MQTALRTQTNSSDAARNGTSWRAPEWRRHPANAQPLRPTGSSLPTTMTELLVWIDREMPPYVEILPKAFRSLRKAPHVDVMRLAVGFMFLRDVYVPYRTGSSVTPTAYREGLVAAGYDEGACFSKSSSLQVFNGYKATWNGRTVWLDRHLKRGIGTCSQTMIRIYFAFDRETGTVIVGHMPGHLDNWKKN